MVVPDMAESTTRSPFSCVAMLATCFILCAEPTEVPPNFKTFIRLLLTYLYSCYFQSSWANWYRLLRQLCHSWAV